MVLQCMKEGKRLCLFFENKQFNLPLFKISIKKFVTIQTVHFLYKLVFKNPQSLRDSPL